MRKLETPNMMKVMPVPSATIARVERGAAGERGTLRKTEGTVRMGRGQLLGEARRGAVSKQK